MKLRLSPQQKKQNSYAKDRRNVYGERGSHSRHAIRDSKNLNERKRRRAENMTLNEALGVEDEERLNVIENEVRSTQLRRKRFLKMPDAPLGLVVRSKITYRVKQGMGLMKRSLHPQITKSK